LSAFEINICRKYILQLYSIKSTTGDAMKQNPFVLLALAFTFIACGAMPALTAGPTRGSHVEDKVTAPAAASADGTKATALPNNSGIEGVQTYPDRPEYHKHVDVVKEPEGNLPPVFGEHFSEWQNCGIYQQPVNLGNVLHSMEHGAVWLSYRPDLDEAQVKNLQSLVRGHAYVLMSPYRPQKSDVVMTAWGVQLIIDSVPDDRIARFISYYEQGPQNPEPGAPCSGALGSPSP
jgi:hypothetical protein